MNYTLIPATDADRAWLEQLRRAVYRDLFDATFGGWDEARHLRHFEECWRRGAIEIIECDGRRVGMIQTLEHAAVTEVGEIQIDPRYQNGGIGSRVLRDTMARATDAGRRVVLSVALKNDKAYRLYARLGFKQSSTNDTHNHMVYER